MEHTTGLLNNRELAIVIWIALLILWTLTFKSFRESLFPIIKTLFSKEIIIPIFLMSLYIGIMTLGFWKLDVWGISNLKDTFVWSLGSALVMLVNINKAKDDKYFSRIIFENLKIVLIVEFIVNVYTFGFWIEVFLVPLIAILSFSFTVAERDQKFVLIKNRLYTIMVLFGLWLIIYSFYKVFIDFINFATIDHLIDFLLPPVFTILFLPFMYLMALYTGYRSVFLRLNVFNKDGSVVAFAKRKILLKFHFNLGRLNKWIRGLGVLRFADKQDVVDLLSKV